MLMKKIVLNNYFSPRLWAPPWATMWTQILNGNPSTRLKAEGIVRNSVGIITANNVRNNILVDIESRIETNLAQPP